MRNSSLRNSSPVASRPELAETVRCRPDVKVLLIHGIGEQAKGSHLVSCVEPIVELLGKGVNGATVEVLAATLNPSPATNSTVPTADFTPAHVVVRTGQGKTWLIAESHWASVFPEPTFRELVYWGVQVVPAAAVAHGIGRVAAAIGRLRERGLCPTPQSTECGQVDPGKHRHDRAEQAWSVVATGSALLQLLLALLLVPLLLAAVMVLLIVGLVPVAGLRALVLRGQRALAGTVGDSYVFIRRPVRRAAILSKVQADLHWLRTVNGGAPVVVVAHSQGAAVAHQVLLADSERTSLLVTYGSGLGKLLMLDRALDKGFKLCLAGGLAVLSAAVLTWAMPGIVGSLIGNPVPWSIFAGCFLAAAVVAALLARPGQDAGRSRKTRRLGMLAAGAGALATIPVIDGLPDILVPATALMTLLSTLTYVAERTFRSTSGAPLPDVERWLDFQADADPVPTGPVPPNAHQHYEHRSFTLTGSSLRDHVSYWKHPDVFTWQLVAELQTLDGSASDVAADLQRRGETAVRHRRSRVRAKTAGRWALAAATLVVLIARFEWLNGTAVLHISNLIAAIPAVGDLPLRDWWCGYLAVALLAIAGVLCCAVSYQFAILPWRAWDALSTHAFLHGKQTAFAWSPILAGAFALFLGIVIEAGLAIGWHSVDVVAGSLVSAGVLALGVLAMLLIVFLGYTGFRLLRGEPASRVAERAGGMAVAALAGILIVLPVSLSWVDGPSPWLPDIEFDSLLALALPVHLLCAAVVIRVLSLARRPSSVGTDNAGAAGTVNDGQPLPVSALAA